MKTKFTWAGIIATLLVVITTFFVACKKDDMNEVVKYHGQVVYINTTTPFANLTVKVTNGSDTHCQTETDGGGMFSLTVRVSEIDGNYYLLAGDETCIPKKVALGGYGQSEVDLGVIEVEGPAIPTVETKPLQTVTANSAVLGGNVMTDGRLTVTARGVCYGTNPYPTVDEKHTTDGEGLGEFTSTLKELEFSTVYYARAYATNKLGTAYGEQVKFTTEEGVAVVVTDSVYRITAHAAKCKGHVVSDGGFTVTKRGTCWSKRPDPTVDDDCTDDGSGLGEFTSTMKNLTENTIYYVRTYATNSTKTTYGEQIIITTLDGLAVVKTDSVSAITATGFTAYGNVLSDCDIPVTARGFCYSTKQYPTIENEHTTIGKGLGEYKSNIVNLTVGTTYFVRAYATNETATVYGEQIAVTTLDGMAVVTTDSISAITATGFTAYGNVLSDCDIPVTARGFCYSTKQYPTIEDKFVTVSKGLGSFRNTISGLEYATTYYVRAYATNSTATVYGEQKEITTLSGLPTVTTDSVTNIGSVKATCGGEVTDDGSLTVTARGVCYGTAQHPTIEDAHTTDGKGMGKFTSSLKNLQDKTTYYVRAYATTDAGTTYGEQRSFKTENGVPVVVLNEVGEPTANSVTCKANVTGDGGVTVTERGLCYSVSQYPTNTDMHIAIGNGVGVFTGSLTGLAINTTYYVRAYAINSLGVGYSEQKSFTTKDGLATITTTEPTSTATTIAVGGDVTDNGGYAVTERGVCYSASNTEPTIADEKVLGGKGNGAFNVSITDLAANTTYHVRAYAINENGTAYGTSIAILTKDGNASVSLGEISNITALTASATVLVSDAGSATLQSCGICWSTNPNPTISDSKTIAGGKQLNSAYTCNLTDLQPNTTYYVRGYATTDITTAYSEQKTFRTVIGLPIVETTSATSSASSIIVKGEVTDNGGYNVTERGVCYSKTNAEPTIADKKVVSGSGNGEFNAPITNLESATTYYVRAYATNSIGTSYGSVINIKTTSGAATVTTGTITNIKALTATGSVKVSDVGGATLQSCGICWSSNPNPTISDAKSFGGNQLNTTYNCNLTELIPNTTYYVRAYATTNITTTYGNEVTFTTTTGLATISTISPTATATTITSGGKITDDGGYAITERGVCYSAINANPTINEHFISSGNGSGNYSCTITDANVSTLYYVRAYAKNEVGVSYGAVTSITTNNGLAVVQTKTISNVRANSVQTGGTISCDNDVTVIERGLCWSTQVNNPTIANSKQAEGSGTGSFISTINNLNASTTYYIRAYATTQYGTNYGNTVTANTTSGLPTVSINSLNYKSVTSSSILVNATVSSEGDASVTQHGFCWSTSGVPTINDTHANSGSGSGQYSYTITNVTPFKKTYYIRAYATNVYGTSYSEVIIHNVENPYNLPVVSVSGNRYMIYPIDMGTYTLAGGKEACNNLNQYGYDDWRMPSINEMSSITEYGGIYYFTENIKYWTTSFVQDVYTGIVQYYYIQYTTDSSGKATVSAGKTTSEYSKYNVRPIRDY